MSEIRYYSSFEQDFSESKQQNYKLPKDYEWISRRPFLRLLEIILYPIIVIYVFCYQKFYARIKIINRNALKAARHQGYYLYSSHTQVFGDVINHFITTFPKHPYLICSPANLGIVAVGKYLPLAGALPIPDNIRQLQKLNNAIRTRISQKKAVITYPEAHVWPWYTGIRPMKLAAFHFPITIEAPVFVATTTYQKTKFRKKPKITIYIDGPVKIPNNLSRKEKIRFLQNSVESIMKKRAKLSTYEYIKYLPKE